MALAHRSAAPCTSGRKQAHAVVSGRVPVRVARLAGGRRQLRVLSSASVPEEVVAQPKDRQTAAEGRWQKQVTDGTVKSVSTRQAGELMRDGWVLLDVRPPNEYERVPVTGAVTVPLFVRDTGNSLGSLSARLAAWGTGGWWLGGSHMVPNPGFMREVESKIPKDAKVVVGCQRGLRSLAACENLSRAGYSAVAWVNGGFDMAQKGDLPTPDNKDLRYAGIGGLSEVLGWTEVQQQEQKDRGFLGGFENILKLVALVLLIDGAVFAWEYIAYLQGQPNPFANLMQ